jgi:catechol 2,3-dioxygenase-like lactoylglutathione lyase family enzyme
VRRIVTDVAIGVPSSSTILTVIDLIGQTQSIDHDQYIRGVVSMSRVQLALNVSDLESSVAFYSTMFGVEPHKRRPGYANFAIAEPPLKLVLIEVSAGDRGTGTAGALNHLGVEVESVKDVEAGANRLRDAGLATFDERDTTCCYALQDKVWVHDPAGAPWEIYTVKDDDPANPQPATSSLPLLTGIGGDGACCTPAAGFVTTEASAPAEKASCC